MADNELSKLDANALGFATKEDALLLFSIGEAEALTTAGHELLESGTGFGGVDAQFKLSGGKHINLHIEFMEDEG
jgi:hypothetical protein